MNWAIAAAFAMMLAGCAVPSEVGACGVNQPGGAGTLTYVLDESLGNYKIGNGTLSFLQVADSDKNPTPYTVEEIADISENGCVWFTVPDGVYHLTIKIPHNVAGGQSFFEEDLRVLAPGDFNFTLGYHNG